MAVDGLVRAAQKDGVQSMLRLPCRYMLGRDILLMEDILGRDILGWLPLSDTVHTFDEGADVVLGGTAEKHMV